MASYFLIRNTYKTPKSQEIPGQKCSWSQKVRLPSLLSSASLTPAAGGNIITTGLGLCLLTGLSQ